MTHAVRNYAKLSSAPSRHSGASAPRASLRGHVIMSLFMLAISWGGVAFVLPIMLQQEKDEAALKARGKDATAEVLTTWSSPGSARSAPTYHARFAFHRDLASPIVTDQAYVTRHEYDKLEPGAHVPIVFDPANPSLAQLNFGDKVRRRHPVIENALWIALFFGILALAWGGHIMAFRDTLQERRATRLRADGARP